MLLRSQNKKNKKKKYVLSFSSASSQINIKKQNKMDKCRICLEYGKTLSLYDLDGAMSYIDMITFIAGKKILMDTEIPKKICHLCQKKLKEAYAFKILIQRSDMELRQKHKLNIINFSNLSDIKIEIEITEPNNGYSDYTYWNDMLMNEEQCIMYKDVLIKKLSNDIDKEQKHIPVLDFLENIKNEPDNDYASGVDMDNYEMDKDTDNDTDEYIPYKPKKGKKNKKKHTKDSKGSKPSNSSICIKPVYLKNVRVMYRDISSKVKKKYKKHSCKQRKDICPFCGKQTTSLKSHILVHTGERNFKCEICSKGFFNKNFLKTHMKRHDAVKSFKCNQCIASFINKGSLKSHMIRHSDQRNYICDTCNKGFKRKTALTRHVMIHNFGNKTVKCELCNMSFYNNGNLKHHMRVHTGERPFKCEICSQPYSYKHDFNRHCFKKHGVFLKRRSIYVMNEQVLMQERALMKDLLLRTQGITKDDKPLNPFKGPQATLAFEQAVMALTTRQIPVDL